MDFLATLLGIACAFLSGTSDFASRWSSKKIGPYLTTEYQFSTATIVLIAAAFILRLQFTLTMYSFLLLTVVSIINFISFIFIYRALQLGPVSMVAPIIYSYRR